MKAFFLLFCSALLGMVGLHPVTETTLTGVVKDSIHKEALIGVTVQVTKDRKLVKGAVTDVHGQYSLQLDPGTYTVEFSYTGYTAQKIADVQIVANQSNTLDVILSAGAVLDECVVVGYAVSRREVSNVSAMTTAPAGRVTTASSDGEKARKKESPAKFAPRGKADSAVASIPPPPSPSEIVIKGARTSSPAEYSSPVSSTPLPVAPKVSAPENPYKGNTFHTKKLNPESGLPADDDRVVIDGVSRRVRVAFEPETYEERIEVMDEGEEYARLADKELDTPSPGIPEPPTPRAGLLTAGEWNDLHNWSKHWLDLLTDGEITQYETMYGFFPKNRYTVMLTNAQDFPVSDAVVQLHATNGGMIWEARTDNTGKAELWANLFDQKEVASLRAEAWINGQKHDLGQPKAAKDGLNRHQINVECQAPKEVDIVWAVDATGSMGDEIEYLKTELLDVIGRAKSRQPELAFRMGTVFYRDLGDEYITKSSGLSADIPKTVDFIGKQFAGGGGDFPEAVHSALEEAIFSQKWSDHAIARICFLVLDASPHQLPEVNASLQRSIREAARLGIRIVPVTASGIQKDTEFLMKFFGLATNGTYVFLTDHSGIGGKHIEPTTDEYKVELLNDLLVRLITEYTTIKTCAGQSAILFEDPQAQPNQPQPAPWQALYYPNPANTQFTLDLPFAVQSVTIYNAEGQAVRKLEKPQPGPNTVNVSDLAPGFYTIRILKDGRMQSGKLMVVRN